jgi:hypothetical protein
MPVNPCCISEKVNYELPELKNFPTKDIRENASASWGDLSKRTAATMLPFLALYKPLSQPIALASGSMGAIIALQDLIQSIAKADTAQIPMNLANTCFSSLCVAGSYFAHPMGMLATTGRDTILEILSLVRHVQAGENVEALENCGKLISNALYLALCLSGGSSVTAAYLSIQVLLGAYYSGSEIKKGNYIEGAGHILMSALRSYELGSHVHGLYLANSAKPEPITPKKPEPIAPIVEKPIEDIPFNLIPDVAQYKGSSYGNLIQREHGITLERAFEIARSNPDIDYFVHHTTSLELEWPRNRSLPRDVTFKPDFHSRYFAKDDFLFFAKEGKWLGIAPGAANTYVKA